MLCRSEPQLPTGPGWLYEPKFDGFRALVWRHSDGVAIRGRNGGRLEDYFPEVARAAQSLPQGTVVDGELVICDERGACFDALLARLAGRTDTLPASLVAFDLPHFSGEDLTGQSFVVRRGSLEQNVAEIPGLSIVPQTDDLSAAEKWLGLHEKGIEGVVAKRQSQRYRPGKREAVKVKVRRTIDCVVGGYRGTERPESLLLGFIDGDGLRYVGQTSRLAEQDQEQAVSCLSKAGDSPFIGLRPGSSRWENFRFDADEWVPVDPSVVCEVAYTQLSFGMFRHSVRLLRWRPDKPSSECLLDGLPMR